MPFLLWLNRYVDLRGARPRATASRCRCRTASTSRPTAASGSASSTSTASGASIPTRSRSRWSTRPFPAPRRLRFDAQGQLWIPSFSGSLIARFDPKTPRLPDLGAADRAARQRDAVRAARRSRERDGVDLRHQQRHADPLRARERALHRLPAADARHLHARDRLRRRRAACGPRTRTRRPGRSKAACRTCCGSIPDADAPQARRRASRRPVAIELRSPAARCASVAAARADRARLRAGCASRSTTRARSRAGRRGAATPAARATRRSRRSRARTSAGSSSPGASTPATSPMRTARAARAPSRRRPILARRHALLLLALQPRLRARCRDRRAALGLRSQGRDRRALAADVPRRRALERRHARAQGEPCAKRIFIGTVDGRLFALDAEIGRPVPRLRRGGQRRSDAGPGPRRAGRVRRHVAAHRDRRRRRRRRARRRRTAHGRAERRRARLRCAQRRAALGLRSACRPARRALPPAADGTPRYRPRNAERVVGLLRRPRARSACSCRSGNAEPGLLRRPSATASITFRARSSRCAARRASWSGSFQTVHHDLWDYDVSSQPTLIDVHARRPRAAGARAGHEDGAPLRAGSRDRRAALSGRGAAGAAGRRAGRDARADAAVPDAARAAAPAGRSRPTTPGASRRWDRGTCREKIAASRSQRGSSRRRASRARSSIPGVAGGINWGSVAFDPARRVLVTNTNRDGERGDARPARSARSRRRAAASRGAACIPQRGAAFAATVDVLVSPLGVPCTAPPWGTLLALEVETGRVLWQVPFGSTRDLAPFPFWFDWGLPSMGGPIVTASGVVFIGAAMDDYLRAFDVETGALLWKQRLPAGGQATPMTYRLRPDGRQFVVIAAGGHGTHGDDARRRAARLRAAGHLSANGCRRRRRRSAGRRRAGSPAR